MLRNYLTIAYRNLKRRPGYAAINLIGLAVGMAVCLLIVRYVQEELSYDDFHPNADRIVAVGNAGMFWGRSLSTPYPLATALEETAPSVQAVTRVRGAYGSFVRGDGEAFEVDDTRFATASFFDVFAYRLLRGDPSEVLAGPNRVVLTRSAAQRIFPRENPIGKSLRLDRRDTTYVLSVTGIVEDPPANTVFPFDALVSLDTRPQGQSGTSAWNMYVYRTYALLHEGVTPEAFQADLDAIVEAHYDPDSEIGYFAEPITELHLSDLVVSEGFTGDPRYLYIFSAIALLVLLIACINYVNLATARAAGRAKEVGVRKTVGATRGQVARQFLGESVLLTLAALFAAAGLAQALLPAFNYVFGTELSLNYAANPTMLLALAGLVVVVGLVAGGYPALYLSAYQPALVLKGRTARGRGGAWLRKGLVVAQFAISAVLIIGTLVIYQQLHYVQTKNLGFSEEHVVVVELPSERLARQHEVVQRAFEQQPGVVQTGAGSSMPGGYGATYRGSPDPAQPEKKLSYKAVNAGYDYFETLGISFVAGRPFSRQYATDDTSAFIINEAFAREMGWTDPVGKTLQWNGEGTVIGVVSNFHYATLHDEIGPVAFRMQTSGPWPSYNAVAVRLAPGDPGSSPGQAVQAAMDQLRAAWGRIAPEETFDYYFLDEAFAEMYRTERRLSQVFTAVAAVAILLACLGLFGLAAFAAERRTKEIGIRKVLGASVPSIVMLLSKDFLKLILIAFVIAVPVAYYGMSTWLEDFAYRIELEPWLFVGAGTLALVIALATVSYQAIKAALANPVDSLRSE